jgi:hypothetical protein
LFAVFLLTSCSDKKKPSLSGDEPVEAEDFVNSFELVKPTYEIADSLLARKEKDSLLISNKIFNQFVPDSVLTKIFGKNAKPKLYLMKRVEVEKQESYLFVKSIQSDKRAILILCFDNENKFIAAMPLMKDDGNASTTQVCGINRKYEIYKSTFLKKADGSTGEGKEVYIFNAGVGQFMLIMTEALDDRIKEVINPIDTLGKSNKFSADYVKDKMNIVSIRDGGKPGKLNFFIHFEKDNGECTGELKGIATMSKTNIATYKQAGDACVIQFNFTSSSVTIKEMEPCGSHRGVKCSFDGTYPRKKEKKPARSAGSKKTV